MKCSEFLGRKSLHKHFCFGLLTEYMGPQGKTIFVLLQLFTPIKSYNSRVHLRNNAPGSADISSDNKVFEKHFLTSFLKPTAWWLVEYSKLWYCYWSPGRRESHTGLVFSLFLAMQLGDLSSMTRDWMPAFSSESMESLPLGHQGISPGFVFKLKTDQWPIHFSFPTNTGRNWWNPTKATKPTSASFSDNDRAPHKWWPHTLRP